MKKLTYEQASLILAMAFQDVEKFPTMRMGQAIWNLLPIELASSDLSHPSHDKWFNSKERAWCITRFFRDLVR